MISVVWWAQNKIKCWGEGWGEGED